MAHAVLQILLLLVFCAACLQFRYVNSTEFEVGGDQGWTIPNSKQDDMFYNEWASKNRFKINDTVRFKYKKDSVLLVTEVEYDKCKASHPIFYANNEDTVVRLDRPGLFYFISGVSGHCERGQKMIIKVLEVESSPAPATPSAPAAAGDNRNDTTTSPPSAEQKSSAAASGDHCAYLISATVGGFCFFVALMA